MEKQEPSDAPTTKAKADADADAEGSADLSVEGPVPVGNGGIYSPFLQMLQRNQDVLHGALATKREQDAANLEALETTFANIRPPQMQPIGPRPVRRFEAMQAFAEPASVLGIFGSLLTRRPLKAALKSANAAMAGYAQGNREAFNDALLQWRDNVDLTLKQNQLEIDRYKADMEGPDVKMILARIKASGTEFGDTLAVQAADSGNLKMVADIVQARESMGQRAQEHVDLMQYRYDQAQALQEYRADVLGQKEETLKLRKEAGAEKRRDRDRAITSTIDQVDKAIEMIAKDPTVVGGLGFFRGAGEKALGIASDLGLAAPQEGTPASDFASLIQSIQLTSQNTLRGSASRWKDAKMQQILSALTLTTNSQVASNQLVQFRDLLNSMASEPLPGLGELPAPTTRAEYDALEMGSEYIDPDTGDVAIKGGSD